MKIKLKTIIELNYNTYILEVTEANILDFVKLKNLFIDPDWATSKWEEFTNEKNIITGASIKNIKKSSFDILIHEYDNNTLELLEEFLTDNKLEYENIR